MAFGPRHDHWKWQRSVTITSLADTKGSACQCNADAPLFYRRSGHLAALALSWFESKPLLGSEWPVYFFQRLSFSKSACVLRSAFIHFSLRFSFVRKTVSRTVFDLSHFMAFIWLTICASMPHSPFVEQRIAYPRRAAQIGHRHTAFGLTQDRKVLGFAISRHLHSKPPRSSWWENSVSEAPFFCGGLPAPAAHGRRDCAGLNPSHTFCERVAGQWMAHGLWAMMTKKEDHRNPVTTTA